MAWTTPGTATVAGLVTASFWNTNWTENVKSIGLSSIQDGQLILGVSPGVVTLVDAASQSARPGLVLRFPDTGTAPTGHLICDGSLVSRTTYSDLFGVIGETFGAGDGSTTFALPTLTAAPSLVTVIKI